MEHEITGLSREHRRARTALAAGMCAISLAAQCAARTTSEPVEPERMIHARLEFPLIGNGKPTGLLAADLDGDKKSELIAITSSPATLQVFSGLSRALLGWDAPRAIEIDEFALGPVWLYAQQSAAKDAPADIVYASRATSHIVVIDARALWKSKDSDPPKKLDLQLPKRPRVLASAWPGPDHAFKIVAITIDDQLVLVRGPSDVVTTQLAETQATCAAFTEDGKDLYVGFQGARKLVHYTFDASGKAIVAGEGPLPGLPRSIIELPPRQQGSVGTLVAGGDGDIWNCGGEKGLAVFATYDGGTIPYALVTGKLLGSEKFVSIALQGQEAVVHEINMNLQSPANTLRAYAGQHPLAGALGDFDGDGLPDLAVANGDAQRLSILFANKDNTFDVAPASKSGRQVHALACGDLDGDGKPDVVSISALEGTLSISKNVGGKLLDHRVVGRADGGDCLRIADLDGDGANDVLFAKRTSETTSVVDAWFGDGKGNLYQRAEVRPLPVGASVGDLLVHDFDGDGRLEALVADTEKSRVVLFDIDHVKDAGAKFGNPRELEVASGPKRLALIDVEGDTKPEIAVALAGPGKTLGVAFLRVKKDKDGVLVLELIRVQPSATPITGLAVADNDQNGFQDIVLLASKSDFDNHLEVYYQGKDRAFTKAEEELVTGLRPYALRMADLDGDSIQDIVCTAQNSHHVNVWLNGGGTPIHFARLADIGVGTGPLDVQLSDLDGDGQVEIVVANAFSNDISVVRVR
jgi:hypothetical protein